MILFTYEKVNPQYIKQLSEEIHEEIIVKDIQNGIDSEMAKAEIIVGWGPTLTSLTHEVTLQFPKLKWLHTLTAGVETIPFQLLAERNILVTNSKGIHGTQMAEQMMGMMISFTRGLHFNLKNQQESRWNTDYPLDELYGKTLCIVGTGCVGRELARKAKAFDMKIIGVNNHANNLLNFDRVVNIKRWKDMIGESDFIATLVPMTPETYHLIGEEELKRMKPTAVFLNFSRGNVVDEEALVLALQKGWLRGAGLDVFGQEPLAEESPLWQLENVLISPHNSGTIPDIERRQFQVFREHYYAYRNGLEMPNQIDLQRKY